MRLDRTADFVDDLLGATARCRTAAPLAPRFKSDDRGTLRSKPKFFRSTPAKGILATGKTADPAIDPTGGDYGGGLIPGFAVITAGEALGHDLWIDGDFLAAVAGAINASDGGAKSRFTHPGLSSDGLAKFLGRTKNASVEGDTVRGDKHLAMSAHDTPDGDLAGYVMARAVEDPASFGASIVFERDIEAEEDFMRANKGEPEDDDEDEGLSRYQRLARGFVSPDPANQGNLPHARLAALHAVDFVDDPAANPAGLFSRGQEAAHEAEAMLSYALGLSEDAPSDSQFAVDPDRVRIFVHKFLSRHGLKIAPKPKPEVKPGALRTSDPTAGKRFLDAYGAQGGVWFAEGKTFEEAAALYAADPARLKNCLGGNDNLAKFAAGLFRAPAAPVFAS